MGEDNKLDVIRDHTERRMANFEEHPLTKYLGPSAVTTVKLIERLASYEGRPKNVPALLDDMLQCYVKRNYPHMELTYQDELPPGLKEQRELEAREAAAALPKPPSPEEIARSAAAAEPKADKPKKKSRKGKG